MKSILPISLLNPENNETKVKTCIEIYELLRKSRLPEKDIRAVCKALNGLVNIVHDDEPLPNYFRDFLDE